MNQLLSVRPFETFDTPGADELAVMRQEFSSPRGIVTIDIDGTLTDLATGNFTTETVVDSIRRTEAAGFLACLHSDRPAQYVETMLGRLGLTTPYLAESGSIAGFPTIGTRLLLDPAAKAAADKLGPKVDERLAMLSEKNGFCFVHAGNEDTISSIAQWGHTREGLNLTADRAIVSVKAKLTAAGYWVVRDALSDTPAADDELTAMLREEISRAGSPSRPPAVAHNRSVTYIEARLARMTKTTAWRQLLRFAGEDGKQYFHIGDWTADIIRDARVRILAVANSSEDIKQAAARVSSRTATDGLIDNLDWLINS